MKVNKLKTPTSLIILLMVSFITINRDKKKKTSTLTDHDGSIREKYFRLENKGWKSNSRTQTIDQINFTATEVPIEYYLLKNNGNDNLFLIDSLYQKHKNERILEFQFEHDQEKDLLLEEFTQRDYKKSVEYMAFTIKKDFYAITSKTKDTIECQGIIFERNFKIAPYKKLLLFFSGINENESLKLIYKDQLFGKGTIKFNLKERTQEIKP